MGLLRMLFWVALFLVSTFAFTVLFEHGFADYGKNCQDEWASLMKFYHEKTGAATPAPVKK